MQLRLIIFLLCLFVIAGCRGSESGQKATNTETPITAQQSPTPTVSSAAESTQQKPTTTNPNEVKPKIDACAMLTSKEIQSIQGEAVKETKLSGRSVGGLNISQCFFTLPTFTNSISLAVTHKGDGAGARDPKEFWKDTFREKEREKGQGRRKDREEEEESAPPQKIAGIGDEAFWTASRAAGALYVLRGNSYVRVSVGGPEDQQSKITKSKALARKVIERL
jgi:hypothetical protein